MTTIAMVSLTLVVVIITAILAATASVATTPPDSMHGRRCFRATTAGAGEAILAAVASILKYAGAPIFNVQAVLPPARNADLGERCFHSSIASLLRRGVRGSARNF